MVRGAGLRSVRAGKDGAGSLAQLRARGLEGEEREYRVVQEEGVARSFV